MIAPKDDVTEDGWTKVGTVSVDGGHVVIGDSAYVRSALQREHEESAGLDWDERGALYESRWKHGLVAPGVRDMDLALEVASGFGDGGYEVHVRYTPRTKVVAEMRIIFVPEGHDRCPTCEGVPSFEQLHSWGTDEKGYYLGCPTCRGKGHAPIEGGE